VQNGDGPTSSAQPGCVSSLPSWRPIVGRDSLHAPCALRATGPANKQLGARELACFLAT